MTEQRDRPTAAFWVAVWTTALLALYVGAYFVLLRGKVYRPAGINLPAGTNRFDIEAAYTMEGVASLLAPVHSLDRRLLRRDYWQTVEHSSGLKWKNPPVSSPATNPAGFADSY